MKLQVNTAGSWKDVIEFDAARRWEVIDATRMLSLALGHSAKFALVDDNGKREWLFADGVTQEVTS